MAEQIAAVEVRVDSSQAVSSMAELRQNIQKANDALISAISKFGEASAEAQEAARQVANYREQMNAANQLTQVMNPAQPFANLLGTLQGVTGGIAAVQGAMALFGGESKAVEEVLLKVNAAMALASGITAIKEAAPAFTAMKTAATTAFNSIKASIGATGIGLLVIAVGALVMNFDKLKNSVIKVNERQKALNDTVGDYKKGAEDATLKTMEMRSTFELARKGVISKEEALKTYNEELGDTFGAAENLNEAEKIFVAKTEAYIKASALRAQADALLKKAAEEQANALTASMEDQRTLTDDLTAGAFMSLGLQANLQDQQNKRVKEVEDNSKRRAGIFEQEAQNLLKSATWLENKVGITNKKDRDDSDKTVKKKQENNKKEKDNNDDKLKQIEEANAQSRERQRQLEEEAFLMSIQDENRRAEVKLQIDFENQRKEINQSKVSQEQKNKELAALDAKFAAENAALKEEQRKKEQQKEEEARQKALKNEQETFDIAFQARMARETNEFTRRQEEEAVRYQKELDNLYSLLNNKEITQQDFDIRLAALKSNNELNLQKIAEDSANAQKEIDEKAFQAKLEAYGKIGSMLGSFSELVGKETAAGKAFAVAQASIDTYTAAWSAFKNAQKNPISIIGPAYPYIQAGLAVAGGIANIKKIISVKVPGKGGSGGTAPSGGINASVNAPIPVQASTTMLDQNQVNQMASATARAFVVESDVSGNQERIRRLNRAARIN